MNNESKIVGVELAKKWSGQNLTYLTSDYGPVKVLRKRVIRSQAHMGYFCYAYGLAPRDYTEAAFGFLGNQTIS